MENEKIWCPLNDWECPYFNSKTGYCAMTNEGADPREECDAFFGMEEDE